MSGIVKPRDGEVVLMTLRKSFFTRRKQILWLAAILALSILLLYIDNQITFALGIIGLFLVAIYAFYLFFVWYYDLYIITSRRLIIADRKGIFTKEYTEYFAESFTDVKYQVKGVLQTITKTGRVVVSTRDGAEVELKNLNNPHEVQEALSALMDATKRKMSL